MSGSVVMRDISMSFGSNKVLRGVDLEVPGGQVTALLGANGAGKSTLIKILSGLYPEHSGTVEIDGVPGTLDFPRTAKEQGIQTVHQRVDEAVVPGLSVAENLLFEQIADRAVRSVASLGQLLPQARAIAEALGLEWTDRFLRKDVYELEIADQQLLTVARAVVNKPKMLILDEPTSALSTAEVENLMRVISELREKGVGILYVSHRLSEIDSIADRLVVLRDGVIRGDQVKPFDWNDALNNMLGEETRQDIAANEDRRGSQEILRVSGLQLFNKSEPFDLSLRAGEVTGIIGLLGSGKTEIAEAITGIAKRHPQKLVISGKEVRLHHPADAVKHGVFLVPEDRAKQSMLPGWSIGRTVGLPFLRQLMKGLTIQPSKERAVGQDVIDSFDVVAEGPDQPVDALSGGNQQKVIVGRWMRGEPTLLILDEPFRGVDIGARRTISRKARDLAGSGDAVLVLTSEVDELLEVADRVIVLVDGNPRLDTYLADTSREEIVDSMSQVA